MVQKILILATYAQQRLLFYHTLGLLKNPLNVGLGHGDSSSLNASGFVS